MAGRKLIKKLLAVGFFIVIFLIVTAVFLAGSVLVRRPSRTNYEEKLFQGVTYLRQARSQPRPLMIHVVKIDTSAPGISFLVTPSDKSSGMDLFASTTSDFLKRHHVQVAINAMGWRPFRGGSYTYRNFYPRSGDPVDIIGLAISNGDAYSTDDVYPIKLSFSGSDVAITRGGYPAVASHVLSGEPLLVEHGEVVIADQPGHEGDLHPRTAAAIGGSGTLLMLVVVDGRQRGYSEGMTLGELAILLQGLGAEAAINLDGGGSTTLVAAARRGARILNSPIHTNIPTRQRPVANHLGVYALPLTGGPT